MKPNPDDYDLDDLIGDERRQIRFVLVFLVLAMLFVAGKSLMEGEPPETPPPPATAPPVPR